MRLILASASPRRAELLASAGVDFEVAPAEVDETPQPGEPPLDYVRRVAREKAAVACRGRGGVPGALLAADTTVVSDGRILGKPGNDGEAREMLQRLSGTVHDVHTGVVLLMSSGELADVVTTQVRFISLTDSEIDWYVSTGEPRGKAGAYAIQGRASRYVDWIQGSWSNVVGLPLATVYRMLKQAGVVC